MSMHMDIHMAKRDAHMQRIIKRKLNIIMITVIHMTIIISHMTMRIKMNGK